MTDVGGPTRIEIVTRPALTPVRYREAVELCERAYDEDDDIGDLMREFEDATHVLLVDAHDRRVRPRDREGVQNGQVAFR